MQFPDSTQQNVERCRKNRLKFYIFQWAFYVLLFFFFFILDKLSLFFSPKKSPILWGLWVQPQDVVFVFSLSQVYSIIPKKSSIIHVENSTTFLCNLHSFLAFILFNFTKNIYFLFQNWFLPLQSHQIAFYVKFFC